MTATKRKSRPAQLADEIEAAGWTVERVKTDHVRSIRAQHPTGEVIIIAFARNSQGRDVYVGGERYFAGGAKREDVLSVAEVRKLLVPDVPFKLDAPDAEVLAAVAGRAIEWRNEMTHKTEAAAVPRGGPHLRLEITEVTHLTGARVLSFASPTGFRSVRIDRITKVK